VHGRAGLDDAVETGECVAVTGPSGSGKTLLLRAIADLDLHEGRVFLDDVECRAVEAPRWRRQVALLPSESRWWHDTVGDHFEHTKPPWLERLGFDPDVLSWTVSRLSTGERQRLALLRVLRNQPKVLLLDEPTANLDADNAARVEMLLDDWRKINGTAVLWITHDREQARRVAQRRFRLEAGRIAPEKRT
jgi:ABC-type iron transport system FetAB ATPase subunit